MGYRWVVIAAQLNEVIEHKLSINLVDRIISFHWDGISHF